VGVKVWVWGGGGGGGVGGGPLGGFVIGGGGKRSANPLGQNRTVSSAESSRLKGILPQRKDKQKDLSSDGHSLCHSENGFREWSVNRFVFATPREFPFPFPFPQNSLEGGGGQETNNLPICPPKKTFTPTHTVTEIRGRCSELGKGWGLGSLLFSEKNAHFGEV